MFDPERRMGGRGVNVGPSPLCLARASFRGAFQRGLGVSVSSEDTQVLGLAVREALAERLTGYLASAWQRGGLEAVASVEALEPPVVRALWQREELLAIVGTVPPAAARSPRAARKIAVLAAAVSEFTFGRAGDMKRRPEPAGACPALASAGFAGSARAPELVAENGPENGPDSGIDQDEPAHRDGKSSGTRVPMGVRQHVG